MRSNGKEATWKVGELARLAGLTVRTLHHWHDIELVMPSMRTASGHRLYTEDDLRRLYQVLALRELGLPLESIATVLDGSTDRLDDILRAHRDQVGDQLTALRGVHRQLSALVARLRTAGPPGTSDLLTLIEEVTKMNQTVRNYFTEDQLTMLDERRERLGEQYFQNIRQQWQELITAVQSEMDAGASPTTPRAQELAEQWMSLLSEFDAGDSDLRAANFRMRAENEAEIEQHGGPSQAMIDYITAANQPRQG